MSTPPLQRFVEEAVRLGGVWRLKTPNGSCEVASNRPGGWQALFWLSQEQAKAAVPEVQEWFTSLKPDRVPLEQLADRWVWGLDEDGVRVGFNLEGGVHPFEVEPLTLFAALAERWAPAQELLDGLSPELQEDVRSLAGAEPVAWTGWPHWAMQEARPGPELSPEEAEAALGLTLDSAQDLLEDLDQHLTACDRSLARSRAWATQAGEDPDGLMRGLLRLGLACDCEVVMNLESALGLEDDGADDDDADDDRG